MSKNGAGTKSALNQVRGYLGKRNAGCSSTVHPPHALVVPHPGAVGRVYCAGKFRGAKLHRYSKGRPNDYGGGITDHFYFTSELRSGCE